jgi:hypothetical protein
MGSACAPIAAMVATSPALPPAPEASVALKLITQAGAGGSSGVLSVGVDAVGSCVMAASSGAAIGWPKGPQGTSSAA